MRLYPDVPARRAATLLRDLLAVALLVLFAWLGLTVHDAVDRLAVLGEGVHGAGSAVQGGFESAADKVEGTPVIGGDVADGLRDAGAGTGGNVAELGERGESAAHRLADLLGLLTFALPAVFVLASWLPGRIDQARRLTDASRALADPGSPERRRLIAMRAAFSLPYGQLLAYTRDPLGDLAAERYDPLVAAALDDAGLRAP
ncbi:MAG: hypothetical protein ACRDN6_14340 [Gaiellaceae bacterium]